jgi:hypothetical protein
VALILKLFISGGFRLMNIQDGEIKDVLELSREYQRKFGY